MINFVVKLSQNFAIDAIRYDGCSRLRQDDIEQSMTLFLLQSLRFFCFNVIDTAHDKNWVFVLVLLRSFGRVRLRHLHLPLLSIQLYLCLFHLSLIHRPPGVLISFKLSSSIFQFIQWNEFETIRVLETNRMLPLIDKCLSVEFLWRKTKCFVDFLHGFNLDFSFDRQVLSLPRKFLHEIL